MYKGKRSYFNPWIFAFSIPILLILCFYILRKNSALINFWVFYCMAPVMQTVGRFWGLFPFSAAECVITGVLVFVVCCLSGSVFTSVKRHTPLPLLRGIALLLCLALWLWSGLCWLWNCTYYADNFSTRSGLYPQPYTFEQLVDTTAYFAQQTARLSPQVPRDELLHFSFSRQEALQRGVNIYDPISTVLPTLKLPATRAKPLLFSRLQSRLGFTGVYFPFTGEANVNVDAPACLFPVTIAHEMSHQRMVAAEDEANFVGILACTTCEDTAFQYSGYLMGLIHLSNAVFSVSPDTLYDIMENYFTPELYTDWMDNNNYWKALESSVEEVAETTYSNYLKQNDQELGIQSYGACVDLLVTHFSPKNPVQK